MNKNRKDIFNLLRKSLRYRRPLNYIKVISSYFISRLIRKPVHWGMPISYSIEPTTSCNLRCPQCPSGLRQFSRETGMLNPDTFKSLVDELYPTTSYITLYFQGEPYLNKNFLKMVHYAASKYMYTATSTNAHYLTKEQAELTVNSGLDRLIISIDGVNQESYSKYRIGGNLEKVLEGTKNLMDAKKKLKSSTPHVIWQFIVFSHNEAELPEIKKLALEYELDELAIKTAQVYDFENSDSLLPENKQYSRYEKKGDKTVIKNKLLNHCWRLWNSCVVTWDGKVVPCCFDKDATYRLGTLENNAFTQIWKNDAYKRFRTQILKGRKHIDICRNCSEGTSIWKEWND